MKEFKCARCGVMQAVPGWIQRDSQIKPWPHRCVKCGAVHSFLKGSFDVISPPMYPITAPGRQSPWIAGNHTPVVAGIYECTFRHLPGHTLRLFWDSRQDMWTHEGQRVKVREMVAWRGSWA